MKCNGKKLFCEVYSSVFSKLHLAFMVYMQTAAGRCSDNYNLQIQPRAI